MGGRIWCVFFVNPSPHSGILCLLEHNINYELRITNYGLKKSKVESRNELSCDFLAQIYTYNNVTPSGLYRRRKGEDGRRNDFGFRRADFGFINLIIKNIHKKRINSKF